MQNPTACEGQSVRFATDPLIPTSISTLLSKRHAVTWLPGAGRIGVSAVGTSVNTMTMNNAPEKIVSNINNNSLAAPAVLLHAYQAPKHGLATPSDKGTFQRMLRHLPEQVMIVKTTKEHMALPLESLLPPATTVIMEEDLTQI